MPLSSRRPLLQALIASLAIHGALLLSVTDEIPLLADVQTTSVITVVVSRDKPDSQAQRAAAPAAIPRTVPADPPRTVARAVAAATIATPAPSPARVPVPSAPPTAGGTGVPATTAPVAAAAAVAANGGLSAPAPSHVGVNADDMRQYRVDLATAARRYKRYPPLAREREWEGTVEVSLDFSSVMPAPEAVLAGSSGHRVLDEQALAMVSQALRQTALPQGLKGRNFRVLLPVQFSLEDDQ